MFTEISYFLGCAHYLWSCHWASQKRAGSVLFLPFPEVFRYIHKISPTLLSFFLLVQRVAALSASPVCEVLFAGFSPVCPFLSCTRMPRSGQRTPGMALPVLSKEGGSPHLLAVFCLMQPSALQKGHVAGSCSAWFPVVQFPAYTGVWGCSSPDAGLCISSC